MLSTIPKQIRAGDDYLILISIPDFSSVDFDLGIRILNQSTSLTFAPTANANVTGSFDLSISSDFTQNLEKGLYQVIGQLTNKTTAKKSTVIDQAIEVLPNLINVASNDFRTAAQKLLEILDQALLKHGSQAYVQSYSLSGRAMQFKSHKEFMDFRNQIKAEANQDTRKQQGFKGKRNKLYVLV